MPQAQTTSVEKRLLGSLSRRAFARRAGLAPSCISRILKGERRMSLDTALRWAEAMDISLDDLTKLLRKAKLAAVWVLLALALTPAIASADQVCAVPITACSGGGAVSLTATYDFSGQFNVCGPDNTTNVEIGSCANDANAGTGGTSTVIGNAATNTGNGTGLVIIGSAAGQVSQPSNDAIMIGRAASAGSGAGTSTSAIVIGAAATCHGGIDSLAIGPLATCTLGNQAVFGANAHGYLDVYFGEGIANTTAASWTLHGTGGSGSDNAGGNLTIMPGLPTGAATGGQLSLNRTLVLATSSTVQTSVNGFAICESKTLSNTTATTTTIVNIASASNSGGGAHWTTTVVASDGTNFDAEQQTCEVSWVNKAGTFTVGTPVCTASVAASNSGSTTVGSTVTGAASVIAIKVTPVFTTIAPTLVTSYTSITNNSPGAVTCQ